MRLTKHLISAGIAVGIATLAWGRPVTAGPETRPPEERELEQWIFAPGRVELGAQIGGGFSLGDSAREATEFSFRPRIGYVLAQQGHVLPGSVEIVGEPTYITVFQHQTVHVGGLIASLKYNVQTGSRWTPYVLGGGGVSFSSHRVPQGGTNFNFLVEGGLGLQYTLTPRSVLNGEWRFQHFSNGDISPPNPSLNMSLFLLGFSFLF